MRRGSAKRRAPPVAARGHLSRGEALLLPLPAGGERVGVRGPLRESERQNCKLRLAGRPPHPSRKRAPTSPHTRGEVNAAVLCGGFACADGLYLVHRFRSSNHIDIINQPRPEERALARVSKDGHRQGRATASILRDAMLRMASQDEVRGIKRDVVRSDRFHRIDPLGTSGAADDRPPQRARGHGLLRQHHRVEGRRHRRGAGRDRHPDRGQWGRQVDADDDDIRQAPRARRPHRVRRPRHHPIADPRDRTASHRPVAGRASHFRAHDRAGEPADGRARGRSPTVPGTATSPACSRCFRGSPSGAASAAARCRAASSRCSPSHAP